jgi:hypothetical protein
MLAPEDFPVLLLLLLGFGDDDFAEILRRDVRRDDDRTNYGARPAAQAAQLTLI